MADTINYFGTALNNHGHYFWELSGERMNDLGLSLFNKLPFNPYDYPKQPDPKYTVKGISEFLHVGGFTVCAIEGSCYDKRWGTKSVFWINKEIPFADFEKQMKETPIVMKIINQMPFNVPTFKTEIKPL